MKYTEQKFTGIFEPFLEKAKKNYLKGKIGVSEISHFAKNFAIEFHNQKTKHLNFKSIESNYFNGKIDVLEETITEYKKTIKFIEDELIEYKKLSRVTNKQIEIYSNRITEIRNCTLVLQSKLKILLREHYYEKRR